MGNDRQGSCTRSTLCYCCRRLTFDGRPQCPGTLGRAVPYFLPPLPNLPFLPLPLLYFGVQVGRGCVVGAGLLKGTVGVGVVIVGACCVGADHVVGICGQVVQVGACVCHCPDEVGH